MLNKIGDIVEIHGKKYKVCESNKFSCIGCDFFYEECYFIERPLCSDTVRNTSIIFKLVNQPKGIK